MNEARIKEIQSLVGQVGGTSLSQIKSQIGEQISWDELRIYQASTII
jgi:hypothetical protein